MPFGEFRAQHAMALRAFYGVEPSALTDGQVGVFVFMKNGFAWRKA